MCGIQHKNHTHYKNQLPLITLFHPRFPRISQLPIVAPDQGVSLPKKFKTAIWYSMCWEIILFNFQSTPIILFY